MNARLVAMLTLVAAAGGGVFLLYTPTPSGRTMLDLRDAGIVEGQPCGVLLHEKDVSRQTINRAKRLQGADVVRPRQTYFTTLRTCRCFGDKFLDGGFGNCVRVDGGTLAPFVEEKWERRYTALDAGKVWVALGEFPFDVQSDGGLVVLDPDLRNDGGTFDRVGNYPRKAEVVIPSLRTDLDGGQLDSDGGVDDGGDDNVVDDARQVGDLTLYHCNQIDALVDAGALVNPYANRFCGGLNRMAIQPSPCMIPNGWRADGGWCEEACGVVDCKFGGLYALPDGGPRWSGFNALPREYAVGSACVPVECSVVAGDVPSEWL